jgi:hypothetical protein
VATTPVQRFVIRETADHVRSRLLRNVGVERKSENLDVGRASRSIVKSSRRLDSKIIGLVNSSATTLVIGRSFCAAQSLPSADHFVDHSIVVSITARSPVIHRLRRQHHVQEHHLC